MMSVSKKKSYLAPGRTVDMTGISSHVYSPIPKLLHHPDIGSNSADISIGEKDKSRVKTHLYFDVQGMSMNLRSVRRPMFFLKHSNRAASLRKSLS